MLLYCQSEFGYQNDNGDGKNKPVLHVVLLTFKLRYSTHKLFSLSIERFCNAAKNLEENRICRTSITELQA
jgi:hypothetical protein